MHQHRLFHLARATRDVIDEVQSSLREHEDFLLGAYLRATMAALIIVVLGISHHSTYQGLEIPMTTQWPGIAVETTKAN